MFVAVTLRMYGPTYLSLTKISIRFDGNVVIYFSFMKITHNKFYYTILDRITSYK
jgi:hypothetical protein